MRKLRPALCALCLVLLFPLLLRARDVLPTDTGQLVAQKYAGWTGVLRLWVFQGWECGSGSLTPWLNRCVRRFEKEHPGVYVQPRAVDAGAIASINDSGILPPDMLLFPPGLLDAPSGLVPLTIPKALRPALTRSGMWNGVCCAVPVAMGGYAWAWNPALVEDVPRDWFTGDPPLAVPESDDWHRWNAALLALCAGGLADESREEREGPSEVELPGLVLEPDSTEAVDPTDMPDTEPTDVSSCRLSSDFSFDAQAWRHFINGEAAAMPVTQREVCRLKALSDRGKGPDWRLARGGAAFTDQLLCLALVDRPDAAEQQALCLEFMNCLLQDECQGELWRASAFSVTGAESGYAPGDPLSVLEASLRDDGLIVPGCFGREWQNSIDSIVRKFIAGSGDAEPLWGSLAEMIRKNPNNIP